MLLLHVCMYRCVSAHKQFIREGHITMDRMMSLIFSCYLTRKCPKKQKIIIYIYIVLYSNIIHCLFFFFG